MSERLRWFAANFEEACCAAMVGAMAVLAFVNILARYLTNYSLAFTEEVEVSLLVWLTLLGAAAGFKRGAHLGLTFLVDRFPRWLRRALTVGAAALAVALFLALVWFGLWQLVDEARMGTTSEALGLPQWIYTLGLPVGGLIMIGRAVQATRRALRAEPAR